MLMDREGLGTMPGKVEKRGHLNIRCSDTARYLLEELQDHLGLSQSGIIEMLLRDEARRRNIPIPGSGAYAQQRRDEAERIHKAAEAMGPVGKEPSLTIPKKNQGGS